MADPVTTEEANELNNLQPGNQNVLLGDKLKGALDNQQPGNVGNEGSNIAMPFVISFDITADATSGLNIFNANAPFKFKIIDAWVECTTANASGDALIDDGTTAITDAMTMAVDKVIARAGTIDDAKSTIAKDGTLRVVTNGASDRGLVSILAKRIA